MSRKRGRTPRQYHVRVRTVRRDPIDYDALARAALEQAAMNESLDEDRHGESPRTASTRRDHPRLTPRSKGTSP